MANPDNLKEIALTVCEKTRRVCDIESFVKYCMDGRRKKSKSIDVIERAINLHAREVAW